MAFTRRLLPEARRRWVLVAGLVFVLHPITAETVDNASFREDSLVTVFTLATLILALDRRPALALVAYALGLLSKESAVMAPALLALLRLGRFDRQIPRAFGAPEPAAARAPGARLGRTIVELIPYGVVTIIYLAIRFGPLNTPVAYARYPGDTALESLVTEMLALSPQFAEMWAEHEVEVRGPMLKYVSHPRVGPLEFECQVLHITETGQRLIAYCAAPGSATAAAFRELAAQPAKA